MWSMPMTSMFISFVRGNDASVRCRQVARAKARGSNNSTRHRLAQLIQTRGKQLFRVKRRLAGEQFVKKHAEAVNVRARINIEARHHGLLRTHVGRSADELFERSKNGFIREPLFSRFGNSEINDLRHGFAVVQGHEN